MPFPENLQWNQPGVEPTQAKKNEGWTPEEKPPAEYFNWFFNRMCQAVNYLKTESDVSNAKFDITGHNHDGIKGNGPKLLAENVVNTLINGLNTDNIQSTLAAIYTEATKKSSSIRNTVITGPVSNGMANVLRDRYSDNLCVGGTPISGGDLYDKSLAFDGNNATVWGSSQLNTAVNGAAWLGYQFSTTKVIRKLIINQATDLRDAVTSIKIQRSTDGSTWNDVVTAALVPGVNVIAVPAATASAYWRVLANSNAITPTVGYAWAVFSLEMYELLSHEFTDSDIIVQPNALVAFSAGFDLVNKRPVDYWELTQQMSLTLAAADAYTVPLSYTDDLCNGGTAISGGDLAGYPAVNAVDNNNNTTLWASSQAAAAVNGTAAIGYTFNSAKRIRKVKLAQSTTSYAVSAVKVQVADGGTWTDGPTYTNLVQGENLFTIPDIGAHLSWRLLAQSALGTGYTWNVIEIEMYEALQTYYVYLTRDANGNVTVGSTRNKPKTAKPTGTVTTTSGYYTNDLCNGGTAISGGNFSGYTAAMAFDNVNASSPNNWLSSQTGAGVNGVAWVGYNFGMSKAIRKLMLSNTSDSGYLVTSVKVEYSTEGTTWGTAGTYSVIAGINYLSIPAVGAYQYWRIRANSSATNSWSVYEIEMYEYVDPYVSTVQADDVTYSDNLCVGGAAIATSETGISNLKEYAFDGNSTTYWVSNTSEALLSRAIGYDFGVARSLRKIVFTTHITPNSVPSAFKIQKSIDGTAWQDVLNYTGVVIGTNTVLLPTGTGARYWRLLANGVKLGGSTLLTDGTSMVEITMHEISNDINLYDPIAGISKHYDGSTWDNVARVFVGEAVVDSAGNIVSYTTYPYNKSKLKALPAEDSDEVVTLGQLASSLSANGYQKLPSGLIIQWGSTSGGTNGVIPVIFPIAFPNSAFFVIGSYLGSTTGITVSVLSPTKTGCTLSTNNTSANSATWFVIGN